MWNEMTVGKEWGWKCPKCKKFVQAQKAWYYPKGRKLGKEGQYHYDCLPSDWEETRKNLKINSILKEAHWIKSFAEPFDKLQRDYERTKTIFESSRNTLKDSLTILSDTCNSVLESPNTSQEWKDEAKNYLKQIKKIKI